jgi:hypothetical protein
MLLGEEDLAIQRLVRESVLENGHINLVCMEGLITNATKTANLRRDQCALLTQQVNHEIVELSIAEENVQNRFQPGSDFSVRPMDFGFETSGPDFGAPSAIDTHNERPSRGANPWMRRNFS